MKQRAQPYISVIFAVSILLVGQATYCGEPSQLTRNPSPFVDHPIKRKFRVSCLGVFILTAPFIAYLGAGVYERLETQRLNDGHLPTIDYSVQDPPFERFTDLLDLKFSGTDTTAILEALDWVARHDGDQGVEKLAAKMKIAIDQDLPSLTFDEKYTELDLFLGPDPDFGYSLNGNRDDNMQALRRVAARGPDAKDLVRLAFLAEHATNIDTAEAKVLAVAPGLAKGYIYSALPFREWLTKSLLRGNIEDPTFLSMALKVRVAMPQMRLEVVDPLLQRAGDLAIITALGDDNLSKLYEEEARARKRKFPSYYETGAGKSPGWIDSRNEASLLNAREKLDDLLGVFFNLYGDINPSDSLVNELTKLANGGRLSVRRDALLTIARLRIHKALPAALVNLEHKDDEIRFAAISALRLAQEPDKDLIQPLVTRILLRADEDTIVAFLDALPSIDTVIDGMVVDVLLDQTRSSKVHSAAENYLLGVKSLSSDLQQQLFEYLNHNPRDFSSEKVGHVLATKGHFCERCVQNLDPALLYYFPEAVVKVANSPDLLREVVTLITQEKDNHSYTIAFMSQLRVLTSDFGLTSEDFEKWLSEDKMKIARADIVMAALKLGIFPNAFGPEVVKWAADGEVPSHVAGSLIREYQEELWPVFLDVLSSKLDSYEQLMIVSELYPNKEVLDWHLEELGKFENDTYPSTVLHYMARQFHRDLLAPDSARYLVNSLLQRLAQPELKSPSKHICREAIIGTIIELGLSNEEIEQRLALNQTSNIVVQPERTSQSDKNMIAKWASSQAVDERVAAARALFLMENADLQFSLPLIRKLIQDSDTKVREMAFWALGSSADSAAAEIAMELLDSVPIESETAKMSLIALYSLGKHARAELPGLTAKHANYQIANGSKDWVNYFLAKAIYRIQYFAE